MEVLATLLGEELTVVVRDEGEGIAPRPDSPGLGLGLPLIASLAENVQLGRDEDEHTEVRMTFSLFDAPHHYDGSGAYRARPPTPPCPRERTPAVSDDRPGHERGQPYEASLRCAWPPDRWSARCSAGRLDGPRARELPDGSPRRRDADLRRAQRARPRARRATVTLCLRAQRAARAASSCVSASSPSRPAPQLVRDSVVPGVGQRARAHDRRAARRARRRRHAARSSCSRLALLGQRLSPAGGCLRRFGGRAPAWWARSSPLACACHLRVLLPVRALLPAGTLFPLMRSCRWAPFPYGRSCRPACSSLGRGLALAAVAALPPARRGRAPVRGWPPARSSDPVPAGARLWLAGCEHDLLAVGLAIDQIQERFAIGVVVVGDVERPRRPTRPAGAPSRARAR